MHERFSERARHAMALANQEALKHNHREVLPAHVLFGILTESHAGGSELLRKQRINVDKLREEVDALIGQGTATVGIGKMPHSAGTRAVIEYAIEEARKLGHRQIGTEHILLGLVRYPDGVPAQVLTRMGININDLREELLALLDSGSPDSQRGGDFEWIHQQELSRAFHSPAFWHTLILASDSAHRLGEGEILPEHLLLGLLRNPNFKLAGLLREKGVTTDWVREMIQDGE